MRRPLAWCLAVALGLGSALAYAALRPLSFPSAYTREFTATGLLERVRYLGLRKRHCALEVVAHELINLSPGFSLPEMPRRGQRVTLYAPLEICRAAEVAAARAAGHLLYRAGEGAARWYLSAPPEPGLACGVRPS